MILVLVRITVVQRVQYRLGHIFRVRVEDRYRVKIRGRVALMYRVSIKFRVGLGVVWGYGEGCV